VPAGATATFNPTSLTGSGTSTMTFTAGASTLIGSYPITITGTSGSLTNSTTPVTAIVQISAGASFVNIDTTTSGTWKGVYGADGFAINSDVISYPAYAQVSINGSSYVWAASTTDERALQKGSPTATDRIASAWYASSTFNIDLNLIDGNPHRVAIYALDWDGNGRAERFDVIDLVSGNVLDTRSISAFTNGEYVVWNLQGSVVLRVTNTSSAANAVVNGIFFDPPAPPDFSISASPASQTVIQGKNAAYTVTVNPTLGFNGVVNLTATGVPAGATATFNPTTLTGSGTSTMTFTAGASTPIGSYPITITGTSGSLTNSTTPVTAIVQVPAAALFVETDTTTSGTWKGVYGADGFAINSDVTSYPAYAQVSINGSSYVWAASTADTRALQKGSPTATDRIASAWYSSTTFNIDLNLTDGNSHRVAIYGLDWDGKGRAERIDVIDLVSGNVLDTRSISAFTNGEYVVWNLQGNILLRVTDTSSGSTANAVVSGIFFDPPAPPAPE
jgi:hypothetical protein